VTRILRWIGAATLLGAAACTPTSEPADGLGESRLPEAMRPDYQVFAQRCSKCHSLGRPLQSGIADDEYWKRYVERMRRQAGSGISLADEAPILRFLHFYSVEEKRRRSGGG
jgi:hypothetical protein